MSLLTLCQQVVDENGLGARPSVVAGSNDSLPRQLFALAKREVEQLHRKFLWQRLTDVHTITTVNGQEGYSLPANFQRYVTTTFWDQSNYWQMRGSITPQLWQALERGIVTTSIRKRFRVRGGEVLIFPTPTLDGETLVAEFQINTPVLAVDGTTYQLNYQADTDTSLIPEDIVGLGVTWRIRQKKGLPYQEEFNEYERQLATAMAQDVPADVIDFTGRWPNRTPDFLANVPENIQSP